MPIFYAHAQGVQSLHILSMLTPFACMCACVCALQVSEVVDLAAVQNGGKAVGCSDMHFGHPKNLINPGRCDKGSSDSWAPCSVQVVHCCACGCHDGF